MYNIFISYRREGGYETARLLYEHLKKAGLQPFFDLEELSSGPFNVRLYKTIDECTNFVLVLTKDGLERCANVDDWLRLEIEHALKCKKNIIPIMMSGFTWTKLPKSIEALATYNAVQMSREYFDASIAKLISMLKDISLQPKNDTEQARIENTYFSFQDKKEIERLKKQQKLLKNFDSEVYTKVQGEYESLYVLDLGSNVGDYIMDRLGCCKKTVKLLGVEYDENAVVFANEKYGDGERIIFIKDNIEDENFIVHLQDAMAKNGIEAFNVVNISMLLLHLKNPYRLLKSLRQVMAKGATLIIKDIDDGFNIAYPDDKGHFQKMIGICSRLETSGYRYSGRQIYGLLKKTGYLDCKLERLGLTSVGMDYDERSTFFDTYFSFIPEDLGVIIKHHPELTSLQQDKQWIDSFYGELEEQFQSENFFFSLGFMLFTAKK